MTHGSLQLRLLSHRLSTFFPYFLILTGLVGIVLTGIVMGRTDLTIRSMVLVVPLILAGVFLHIKRGTQSRICDALSFRRTGFINLSLLYVLLLIISIIIIYINHDRPLEYFVAISIISGVIFLQALHADSKFRALIILTEISILSLCLIWGVTLNYPLYYGGTDPLQHLYLIDSIAQVGHINEDYASYANFPLFHILIVISYLVCNLPLSTTLFLAMGLIWPIGIVTAYLMFRKLIDSRSLALIACLLFGLNAAVIQFGMYPVTRSLAFIFYLFIILLMLPPNNRQMRTFFIQIIFLISLILTHHFTALLAAFVFILILAIDNYILRSPKDRRISGTFVMLYVATFFSYLVYIAYAFTKSSISNQLSVFQSEEISGVGEIVSSSEYALTFIINNSYAALALFLSLLGVGYLVMKNNEQIQRRHFIILLTLISLMLYIPGAQYLLSISDSLLFYRIQLLVAPFIALGMAIGIKHLLSNSGRKNQNMRPRRSLVAITATIVIILTFSSMLSNNNSVDSSDLNQGQADSRYFSAAEVSSMLFISKNADITSPLYSDYYVIRDRYHLQDFNSLNVLTGGNITYIEEGYIIFRINELLTMDTLKFSSGGRVSADLDYNLSDQPDDTNIILQLDKESAIFDNGAVKAYLV